MADEIPPLNEPLPADVLAAIDRLPLKPDAPTLEGERVRLRPFDPDRDVAELHAISNGGPVTRLGRAQAAYDAEALIWRFIPVGPFATESEYGAFQAHQHTRPDGASFVVEDRATDELLGSLTYMANVPAHLKIEIGAIWYTPPAQASFVNTDSCHLLIDHAFALGYRRVEWKCNALNERSRRAALRLGFQFEGVQQAHQIAKGRNRDTAWYRILADEWPR